MSTSCLLRVYFILSVIQLSRYPLPHIIKAIHLQLHLIRLADLSHLDMTLMLVLLLQVKFPDKLWILPLPVPVEGDCQYKDYDAEKGHQRFLVA